jgi:hypothetical protein
MPGSGIAIAEQAVVSGDVIGPTQQTIYEGPAQVTNILSIDETKRVHTCTLCGLKGTIATGFHTCPGCGRTCCAQHVDRDARVCMECRDAAAAVRADLYRQQVVRGLASGGLIAPWQRSQLDAAWHSLGLSATQAAQLEESARRSLPGANWGPDEQRQLDAAERMLLHGDDAAQALAYLAPLAERHPSHDAVQTLWFEALSEQDPERALQATERAPADVAAAYLARARLLARQGRHQEGLDLLTQARGRPRLHGSQVRFLAAAAEIAILQYLASGNELFLGDAATRLGEAACSRDPYVLAVAAWLKVIRRAGAKPDKAAPVTASDIDHRRIRRLAVTHGHLSDVGAATGTVYRSHAHRTGTIWTSVPGRSGYIPANVVAQAAKEPPARTAMAASNAEAMRASASASAPGARASVQDFHPLVVPTMAEAPPNEPTRPPAPDHLKTDDPP